ncbi:MAG: hypothetical protein JNK04_08625 [Myxococcales bacterium]|nr:hypothetical protein [Myxococcales bacterium]
MRHEALALDGGALRQVTVDIPTAAIIVRGALPALQRHRAAVVAAFREFDLGQYDKIELYTRALTQANGEYLATSRGVAEVPALTEALKEIRTTLLTDMRTAVRRKLIDRSHLDRLQGAKGAKNTATDVITLCALVRKQWSALAGRTAVDLREIDRAELLAEELQSALALAENADGALVAAGELRQRVYTLFFNAYDEARRAISFLRWREGDANEIAPSLMALRTRRTSRAEPAKPQETGPDENEMQAPVDF